MVDVALRREEEPTKPAVLIVDDEFMIRVMIADYLQECGFKVLTARDASEAIAVLEQGHIEIHVVFMDIEISGDVDGVGLARWIRERKPKVRVILGAGDRDKSDLAKGLCESGPLMQKPYDLEAVVTRVRFILKDLNF